MSEASAHLLLALAQHGAVQGAVRAAPADDRYLDRVIAETLRLYPLFGVSHRIASADIQIDAQTTLRKGSVLCFNHPAFHRIGYQAPERFDPSRWENLSEREANYIPFGVPGNRPCPAQAIALVTLRTVAREMLRRFTLHSSVSHTRALLNGAPCLVVPRARPLRPWVRWSALAFLRARDRWEDVHRSIVQLLLGSYMVWDARRRRMCERYFAAKDT